MKTLKDKDDSNTHPTVTTRAKYTLRTPPTARTKRSTSTTSPMARKYRARDAHVAFFKPLKELSTAHRAQRAQRQRKCMKTNKNKLFNRPAPMSKKQKYEAMRLSFELNQLTGTPVILGHHLDNSPTNSPPGAQLDKTIALPRSNLAEMLDYIDNLPQDHTNLQLLP